MDAWVLNLDADFELAFGAGYAPKKNVTDAMRRHALSLVSTLTAPDDVIVDEQTPANRARGLVGRAFCPTPRAIAMLERAGALPAPHPSFESLRRVNARAFCDALGDTMPDASFERDLARAVDKLSHAPSVGDGWRVKRSFGVAGRGQRVVRVGEDASFLKSWIDEGGVQIEPHVDVVREYAMHGMLDASGAHQRGALVMQTCDSAGAWISSALATNADVERALATEMNVVARALHDAGYFGPFAIDAFEWRSARGIVALRPRSEINARYTMAFALGYGARAAE